MTLYRWNWSLYDWLGDFVIARSMASPFPSCRVIDDKTWVVTHVIAAKIIFRTRHDNPYFRGARFWNTKVPHIPLLLAPESSKLSKRKAPKQLPEYRDAGLSTNRSYQIISSPPAGILAMTGSHDLEEIIALLICPKFKKRGASFDEEKLKWMITIYDKINDRRVLGAS